MRKNSIPGANSNSNSNSNSNINSHSNTNFNSNSNFNSSSDSGSANSYRSGQAASPLVESYSKQIDEFFYWGRQILLGKEEKLMMALCCLFAEGHLLLEDVPGVGKTTLALFLSRVLELKFRRIQFTNDLLPADILGVSIFDQKAQIFVFHPGPVFGQIILADEINRATPKTQSALLEVMEELQATVDGQVYPMELPFFVVATQNPFEHIGTYSLPESQLDRFLMSMDLGYPEKEFEKQLLREGSRKEILSQVSPALSANDIFQIRQIVNGIFVSDSLIDYIQRILEYGRRKDISPIGLSSRAGLGLVRTAKAYAFLQGRSFVIPEDVQAVAEYVLGHRLTLGLGQGLGLGLGLGLGSGGGLNMGAGGIVGFRGGISGSMGGGMMKQGREICRHILKNISVE